MQSSNPSDFLPQISSQTPCLTTIGSMANSGMDLHVESYGTFNTAKMHETGQWPIHEDGSSKIPEVSNMGSKVFTKRMIMVVVALGIFTYHCMTYDHLLPIFLQDERNEGISALGVISPEVSGGLGMTTQTVGFIMSVNGFIALFVQAVIFPVFAAWLGVWKLLIVVTILHPLDYILVPFLVMLPRNLLYPGIWTCLTIRSLTVIPAYPLLLILLKESSTSPSVLGKVNGLAASAAAACRCIAPPIAGYLYSLGARQDLPGLAWWGSSLVALIGVIQIFWVDRDRSKPAIVISCLATALSEEGIKDIVQVKMDQVEI